MSGATCQRRTALSRRASAPTSHPADGLADWRVLFGLFWLAWILGTLLLRRRPRAGARDALLPDDAAAGRRRRPRQRDRRQRAAGHRGHAARHADRHPRRHLPRRVRQARLARAARRASSTTCCSSAPSIVIGLFVYSIYVAQVRHFSGWAGALALALIVIPVVVRTTDDMLKLVPNSLREATAALGCPAWKMIVVRHLPRGAHRHHHRHPAGGGAHQRRDRAAAVHRRSTTSSGRST